jgi:omega-6 fatty acid desaturase (delta-12 desaturase)
MEAVDEHDGHERGNCAPVRAHDVGRRNPGIPDGAPDDHAAGSIHRVWLFYVQHQFEETLWAKGDSWDRHDAALHGSSHYDLPPVLRWFTANIGVHHVHHLCSRIPFYRLGQVLRDHPELRDVSRLTLLESFRCVRLVLWDEAEKRLISIKELRARSA